VSKNADQEESKEEDVLDDFGTKGDLDYNPESKQAVNQNQMKTRSVGLPSEFGSNIKAQKGGEPFSGLQLLPGK
jgi:hypothetical protein